jgi:acetyl esterase/lipase
MEDYSILSLSGSNPDVEFSYGSHPDQIAEVRNGSNGTGLSRPMVIVIHGGFWSPSYDRTHISALSTAISREGFTTVTLEYRRIISQPDITLQDIKLGIECAQRTVSACNGRVILVGHSAGGHLALWAAATCENILINAVVALAPVADLALADHWNLGGGAVRMFLGTAPANRVDADPAKLPAPRVPVVCIHGAHDRIVPVAITSGYRTIPGVHFTLIELENTGHFALIDPRTAAWQPLRNSLCNYIKEDS